jgi:phosphoglycolate phosphatase-like HAD superfamily hydrolase
VTTTSEHRLVLWDIDQTLVEMSGLGAAWYATAMLAATGVTMGPMPVFGGRTERAITIELLITHDVEPTEETIRRVWAELVLAAEQAGATILERGRALPGAAAALSSLAGESGVVQSLVTGNLPEVSRHKLTPFDLHTHIDFEIGGYGSLSAYRPELVPRAVELATAKHSREFPPESVVVIGDTPHDVEAALQHDAVAVAVATGQFSADELRDAGARTVLADLSDLDAVRTAILRTHA